MPRMAQNQPWEALPNSYLSQAELHATHSPFTESSSGGTGTTGLYLLHLNYACQRHGVAASSVNAHSMQRTALCFQGLTYLKGETRHQIILQIEELFH